jgi:alkylresorcinol/alkylpyrone synthase
MLAVTEDALAGRRTALSLDVSILAIATAVPKHMISQADTAERAKKVWPQYAQFDSLYMNTGIERRFACEPIDWYYGAHGWEDRSEAFRRHAVPLLEEAARGAIARAGLAVTDIDAVVVNTVTGIAVPSLDAMLFNRMPFRPDTERLPIFGFGCGGGVAGLSRAARIAVSMPGANVLFLTVDLCTLCLRLEDQSLAMFISAALFGDGAAAVVLRKEAAPATDSACGNKTLARIVATGEHLWPATEHIMGWDIKHDGFGIVISPQIPTLVERKLAPALDGFLMKHGLSLADFDGFLIHPGGRKVLEMAQAVLGVSDRDVSHSWQVLRDYGNMSAGTALFVLEQAVRSGARGRHLFSAFGPGFSAYFAVLDL